MPTVVSVVPRTRRVYVPVSGRVSRRSTKAASKTGVSDERVGVLRPAGLDAAGARPGRAVGDGVAVADGEPGSKVCSQNQESFLLPPRTVRWACGRAIRAARSISPAVQSTKRCAKQQNR